MREVSDCLHLVREWADALAVDSVAQEVQLSDAKLALSRIDQDLMLVEAVEDKSQMMLVFLDTGAGNEQVIDVGITEGQALKDLVHEALKCLCCITQSKRHPKELEQTEGCRNCCLGDICWLDWDLVVRSDEVEF